jgi:tetratricopeptide (TPR) repeat protein
VKIDFLLLTKKLEVEMKTLKYSLCSLLIICIAPLNMLSQVKEIPITTSSKEALSLYISGRDKIENFETVSAAKLFDQAIQKDPEFAMAYLYRSQSGGGANVFRQNLDKAISLTSKVSEGERLQILYSQALANGNGLKQKEYLDQLLKLFPSDKRVHGMAGLYYYGLNDFSKSLEEFTKSTELDNKYVSAINMVGYCQSALENYPEAEKAFQTYIKLIPEKAASYDSFAELLLKMGKYDESIAQYKIALAKDPTFSYSLTGLGNNYIFKGDYASARKYYQEYFDKTSAIGEKLSALFLKATSFVHEGKIDEALSVFDEYHTLAVKEKQVVGSIMSYAFQGYTLSEMGNPAEGMKYYEKAAGLIDKSDLSEAVRENMVTASLLWRFYFMTSNNELDKATAESEKCKVKVESRKDPGEEMLLNSIYAFLEIRKGNYEKAIQYLSKADTQDPLNWYYTAVAYNKMGDKQNASKLFEKIIKYNVNSINLALVRKRAMEELKK